VDPLIKPVLKDLILIGNPAMFGKLEIDETVDVGDDFLLNGTACIGTEESDACDFFDFTIISPKALEQKLETTKFICGRAYFIVKKLDIKLLREEINTIVSNCQGDNWEEIALRLSPYFNWEYDK
jgi:hypothetical protein